VTTSSRTTWLTYGLVGACALALVGSAGAQSSPSQAPGVPAALRAEKLRPDERIVLDGSLSHPAWQRATAHERFSENQPRSGAIPPQRTSVQVLFDEQALYVGVIAFDDQPQLIRDVPVRHDNVNRTQDFVVAYVDPIGNKSSAQFFRVSAAGSTADGIHTAVDDSEDFSPDFDWDAAVQRRADGWSAVLRIPFATLRFAEPEPGVTPRPWRFMLARRLPREQFHLALSVDLPRGSPSFIDQLQTLEGVTLPQSHNFLTLRPSLTLRQTRIPDAQGLIVREQHQEAGLDLKWRPRAELVIDATIKPDFSQVALDIPQLTGNTSFALYLPEKRPFFFESADLLRSPTDALYTRSITRPRGGLRATWRSPGWSGTALVADDQGGGSVLLPGPYGTDAADQPGSRVLIARGQRRGGPDGWTLGGLLASRQYEDDRGANHVAGADVDGSFGEGWRMRAQVLASQTTARPVAGELREGPAQYGLRAYAWVQRQTENAESSLSLDDISAGFRHDSGFVNQSGVRSLEARQAWKWQQLGPFNSFDLYVEASETQDRSLGQSVKRAGQIGFWSSAARNLEWWLELYPRSTVRTQPQLPPVVERYLATGLVMTPAEWWPLVDTSLSIGKLADAVANRSRPGARWSYSARLRPWRTLELELSLEKAWLYNDSGAQRVLAYYEAAEQALAIWHLTATQNLRLIVQRSSLDRRAEPGVNAERDASRSASLTWQWRRSTGTQLFVGITSQRGDGPGAPRSTEAFVKLQFDVGEVRDMW
jgi:Domain of unknown function (DUF5916)